MATGTVKWFQRDKGLRLHSARRWRQRRVSCTSAPSSVPAWVRSMKARSFHMKSKLDSMARQDQRGKPSRHVRRADCEISPRMYRGLQIGHASSDMKSSPPGLKTRRAFFRGRPFVLKRKPPTLDASACLTLVAFAKEAIRSRSAGR